MISTNDKEVVGNLNINKAPLCRIINQTNDLINKTFHGKK
jgi:hypothetical protein